MNIDSLYSSRPNLILGFHGCDQSVVEKVICGLDGLKFSENDYDWLGSGIYFWENNLERAWQWAKDNSKISNPAVIGAVIDLGYCLDLTDSMHFEELKMAYDAIVFLHESNGIALPKNIIPKHSNSNDMLLRRLDCAVINMLHDMYKATSETPYDSVRGMFWEGNELYPGAGFKEKNHIQICVRNPIA